MQNYKKKSAQVYIYSLADLTIGQRFEFTFLKGKLGGHFVVN